MAPNFLTTSSTVLCPHGGKAVLSTSNAQVLASGAPVLLQTDLHTIANCPVPTAPGSPGPCIQLVWTSGTALAGITHAPALTDASIGICISATGAPAGPPTVTQTQNEAGAI